MILYCSYCYRAILPPEVVCPNCLPTPKCKCSQCKPSNVIPFDGRSPEAIQEARIAELEKRVVSLEEQIKRCIKISSYPSVSTTGVRGTGSGANDDAPKIWGPKITP